MHVQQKLYYWSPSSEAFQHGTIVWMSPRQNLVAVQNGAHTDFLTPAELAYDPRAAADDHDFKDLPAADPQTRPDQERYLRVLASAYPDYAVCSITVFEGVRTSCRTGIRSRVFCQAAVLRHPQHLLILDIEGDNVWFGGVAVADLKTFADKPWSPYVGVPNQWDAFDIPQHEMATIVKNGLTALTNHVVISYPPAVVSVNLPAHMRALAASRRRSPSLRQFLYESSE